MKTKKITFNGVEFAWLVIAANRMKMECEDLAKKKETTKKDSTYKLRMSLAEMLEPIAKKYDAEKDYEINLTRPQAKEIRNYAKTQSEKIVMHVLPAYEARIDREKDLDLCTKYRRYIDGCRTMLDNCKSVIDKVQQGI